VRATQSRDSIISEFHRLLTIFQPSVDGFMMLTADRNDIAKPFGAESLVRLMVELNRPFGAEQARHFLPSRTPFFFEGDPVG